mmetsp:Transcript_82594/g.242369  ORF Transcript_82594/g.242369 Transcript_82594/m.242369 type:complete len:273 (-) Transcript_82594:705-1523(-)
MPPSSRARRRRARSRPVFQLRRHPGGRPALPRHVGGPHCLQAGQPRRRQQGGLAGRRGAPEPRGDGRGHEDRLGGPAPALHGLPLRRRALHARRHAVPARRRPGSDGRGHPRHAAQHAQVPEAEGARGPRGQLRQDAAESAGHAEGEARAWGASERAVRAPRARRSAGGGEARRQQQLRAAAHRGGPGGHRGLRAPVRPPPLAQAGGRRGERRGDAEPPRGFHRCGGVVPLLQGGRGARDPRREQVPPLRAEHGTGAQRREQPLPLPRAGEL